MDREPNIPLSEAAEGTNTEELSLDVQEIVQQICETQEQADGDSVVLREEGFDEDGNMFDDLKRSGGDVARDHLSLLLVRISEIRDHLAVMKNELDLLQGPSVSQEENGPTVEERVENVLACVTSLELAIESLNDFTEPIQILYAIDCDKGPFKVQQSRIRQIMSETEAKQQAELADEPHYDPQSIDKIPDTPTSENFSLFSHDLSIVSSMTSAGNETRTFFDLDEDPVLDEHDDEGLNPFKLKAQRKTLPQQSVTPLIDFQKYSPGVSAKLTHSIHGHLDGPQSTAASILVFRFDLSLSGRSNLSQGRFTSLSLQLSFAQPRDKRKWQIRSYRSWNSNLEVFTVPKQNHILRVPLKSDSPRSKE